MTNLISKCYDCDRKYGDKYGFPDLIIPLYIWKQISPHKDESGLLCPSCICARLHNKNIKCEGSFMSGPVISITYETMNAIRRIENIELKINVDK